MQSDSLTNYRQAKATLNPGQKKAVETIEGPVLVIAGPGTGKTQVLSLRVAEILEKQSDISAGNILCLTYTNAGVIAMRKRLISFIGPEAHKVQIHTFHSFCNQVIQENADRFDIRDNENISELEQYELMEEIVDKLPASHPLFHKSSYHEIKNLLELFKTMKQEDWNPDDIRDAVQTYLDDLPTRAEFQYKRKYKEFQSGDPNPKLIKEAEGKMKRLLSAVELFPQYQAKMQAEHHYDFQDMILWVIEAFQNDKALLAGYQERYQYLLVDEFQDTNGSQKHLIDLLSQYWETPNIFVVGDDDQSIYRFQGANLRNIMEFYRQYKDTAEVVTITQNYRSSSAILDLAEHIIEKNDERLTKEIAGLDKHLTAHNPQYATSPLTPRLIGYHNSAHQDIGIVQKLLNMREQNQPLDTVAVIYQNHAQVADLLRLCEAKGIPVQVKENADIMQLPIIVQVLSLLRYFCDEAKHPFSREDILFRSLYFRFFRLAPRDIGRLALWRRQEKTERFLKQILMDETALGEIEGISDPKRLLAIGKTIAELEQDFVEFPPVRFLEMILQQCGVLRHIAEHADRSFLLRALTTFRGFVRELSQKNPELSVADLLDVFDRMQRHNISLPIMRISHQENGVHFVTAHSAKGLEFEHVFLLGVDKNIWDKKQGDRGFSFPDTLTRSNSGDFFEEKRRLFFVALTRAKQHLEVSFCENDLNGKEHDHSQFVSELAEKLPIESCHFSETEVDDYQFALLRPPPESDTPLVEAEFLRHLLEDYRMSATHLNTYLDCPLAFYFQHLLKIPSAPNPYAAFGTAIHDALEQEFQQAKQIGSYGTADKLIEFFENGLNKHRYAFGEAEFQKSLAHGKSVLAGYFDRFLAGTPVAETYSEYRVSTEIAGIPASGNLDKIEVLEDGGIRITDYKTGNPSNPNTSKKLERPSDKNNFLGGDYWRQVVFYTLLLQSDPRHKWEVGECAIDFVEPQKDGTYLRKTFVVTEEDKAVVSEQIRDSYVRIQKMEFGSCHKEDCHWCNLLAQS